MKKSSPVRNKGDGLKRKGPPTELMDPSVGSGKIPDQPPDTQSNPKNFKRDRDNEKVEGEHPSNAQQLKEVIDLLTTAVRFSMLFKENLGNCVEAGDGSWLFWIIVLALVIPQGSSREKRR